MNVTDIVNAHRRIQPHVLRTPLVPSPLLGRHAGTRAWLKMEHVQLSGSFKPRGAFNKIIRDEVARIVAPTAGGHGVGLSCAAKALGVEARIYLPRDADPDKVTMLQQNGASLVFCDSMAEARSAALVAAEREDMTYLSAYNDTAMIEGGGTVALEILDEHPSLDCLIVGVGGGGLIAGMGLVLKAHNPKIRIIGVQQENAPVLARWFERGAPHEVPCSPSIAEGIGASVEVDTITWPMIQTLVDEFVLVSEQDIKDAMRWLLEHEKLYIEPSGAVGVAALLKRPTTSFAECVTVLTGRNVSRVSFDAALADAVPVGA